MKKKINMHLKTLIILVASISASHSIFAAQSPDPLPLSTSSSPTQRTMSPYWATYEQAWREGTVNSATEWLQRLATPEASDTLNTLCQKRDAIRWFRTYGGHNGFDSREATAEDKRILRDATIFETLVTHNERAAEAGEAGAESLADANDSVPPYNPSLPASQLSQYTSPQYYSHMSYYASVAKATQILLSLKRRDDPYRTRIVYEICDEGIADHWAGYGYRSFGRRSSVTEITQLFRRFARLFTENFENRAQAIAASSPLLRDSFAIPTTGTDYILRYSSDGLVLAPRAPLRQIRIEKAVLLHGLTIAQRNNAVAVSPDISFTSYCNGGGTLYERSTRCKHQARLVEQTLGPSTIAIPAFASNNSSVVFSSPLPLLTVWTEAPSQSTAPTTLNQPLNYFGGMTGLHSYLR